MQSDVLSVDNLKIKMSSTLQDIDIAVILHYPILRQDSSKHINLIDVQICFHC